MKKIIFHGDDFGLSTGFNTGIEIACRRGLLRSTSIRTNGTAFAEACDMIRGAQDLGVGVHLNLVEGRSGRSIKKSDPLCDGSGYYRYGFVKLYHALKHPDARLLQAIEDEIKDQIECLAKHEIIIDHIDSHRHTHMIPTIFKIACQLANDYNIPAIRLVKEPFHIGRWGFFLAPNLIKHLLLNHFAVTNERLAIDHCLIYNPVFLGVMHTGFQNVNAIMAGLNSISHDSLIQVLLHPCQPNTDKPDQYLVPYLKGYIHHPARIAELQTLIDPEFIQFIRENDFHPTNYLTLARDKTLEKNHLRE